MSQIRKQDREAGLVPTTIGTRTISAYDAAKLLQVLERVAAGALLQDIELEPGMPTRKTIHQWIVMYPEARQAYAAARELSAEAFEEEAIKKGRQITNEPGTSQKVRAFEVLMNQLRWSASRRNPKKFGDQRQTQVVVPVQINTSLRMADLSAGTGTEEHPNIYRVEAKVQKPVDVEFNPLDPTEPQVPLTNYRGKGDSSPRKEVLKPRGEVDREKVETRKERKNRMDKERWDKKRAAVKQAGGDPVGMSWKEMNTWLAEHPQDETQST